MGTELDKRGTAVAQERSREQESSLLPSRILHHRIRAIFHKQNQYMIKLGLDMGEGAKENTKITNEPNPIINE